MENLLSGSDRGQPKYSESFRLRCHFFHHKFDMECSDFQAEYPGWDALTNRMKHAFSLQDLCNNVKS
jgi:hypothetical protein